MLDWHGVDPVLHLSIPVADLAAARAFYVDTLGCRLGRVRDEWLDVWFYGLQLTLQKRPAEVRPEGAEGVRHFGVTLDAVALGEVLERLRGSSVRWVAPVTTDALLDGKTSAKVQDPSGNVIEFKAYAEPARLLDPS
jgi:extradiol dioxygenase family protein